MIFFKSISESVNAEDYLTSRLGKLLGAFPEEQRAEVLSGFAEQGRVGVMPIYVPTGAIEGAPEAAAATRSAAEELYPLAPGEQVEEEELCALLVRGPEPEGSPLMLRQTTNFAQTFIQVRERIVSGGRVVAAPKPERPPRVVEPSEGAETFVPAWALALARQLGQKLLQQLGSAVWDAVRKEVLGKTDLPSYYEQVYNEIRQIVASAFQEHYIKEVKDLAAMFGEKMGYYNNMGRKLEDFTAVLNTSFELCTKADTLGAPGTYHYAEASVLHVMALWEGYKRRVEERASPADLRQSKAYIGDRARQFADNVTKKHGILVNARMATISKQPYASHSGLDSPWPVRTVGGVNEGVYDYDETFLYSCLPIQNMFRDSTNGFWNAMYFHLVKEIFDRAHSWNWVNNNLKRYREQIYKDTLQNLNPLLEVADRLRHLAEGPPGNA